MPCATPQWFEALLRKAPHHEGYFNTRPRDKPAPIAHILAPSQ